MSKQLQIEIVSKGAGGITAGEVDSGTLFVAEPFGPWKSTAPRPALYIKLDGKITGLYKPDGTYHGGIMDLAGTYGPSTVIHGFRPVTKLTVEVE